MLTKSDSGNEDLSLMFVGTAEVYETIYTSKHFWIHIDKSLAGHH